MATGLVNLRTPYPLGRGVCQDAIKENREDGENIRDVYYAFDKSGEAFVCDAWGMWEKYYKDVKNKINCRAMFNSRMFDEECKKAGKKAEKKYVEAFNKIIDYPLCFAVMDKK